MGARESCNQLPPLWEGMLSVGHLLSCLLLKALGWRGVIGELNVPTHNCLASGSVLTLQISSLSSSQPRSSPSVPPVLCLVLSL